MDTESANLNADSYTYQPAPDESISEAVVRAMAELSGRSAISGPDGLPPLYETVDPDALDALFTPPENAPVVQFTYSGYAVTVDEQRQVTVAEA